MLLLCIQYIVQYIYKIEKAPFRKIGFHFWHTYYHIILQSRSLSFRTHTHFRALAFFFSLNFSTHNTRTHVHICAYTLINTHTHLATLFSLHASSTRSYFIFIRRRPSNKQYIEYSSSFNQKYISIYLVASLSQFWPVTSLIEIFRHY